MSLYQTDEADAFHVPPRRRPRRWPRWSGRVLLVTILLLLVAVPVSWLCGVIQTARESSNRATCKCRLKQFGVALHNYHDAHGSFPPAFVLGPDGQKWHSWRVLLLPQLEQQKLFDEYRFDEPWDGPNNRKLIVKMPEIFACPSQPCPTKKAVLLSIGELGCAGGGPSVPSGFTSFAAAFGEDCVFRGVRPVSIKDITDGMSNTLLIGECTRTKIPWTKPDDIDIAISPKLGDADGFGSPHSNGGGAHFLMGDGMVRFIPTSLPQTTLDRLFDRNGRENEGISF